MKLIVVLGMHRSGTSAVAGMLQLLGGTVGAKDDLLPPAEDNPTGFFEHRDLKAINDAVLRHLGGTWSTPPMTAPGWERDPGLDKLRARGRRLLDELGTVGQHVILKDPRMCLTLPFWRTIAPLDHVVMALRDPVEVAGSLMIRNGLSAPLAVGLWTRYVVEAVSHTAPDIWVTYSELVRSPLDIGKRLAPLLGQEFDGSSRTAVEAFVDPELRHHDDARIPPSPALELANWLYEALVKDPESARRLAAGIASTLHGDTGRGRTGSAGSATVQEQLAQLHTEKRELEAVVRSRDADLTFFDARLRRLRFDLDDAQTSAAAARHELTEAKERRNDAEGRVAAQRRIEQQLRDRIGQLEAAVAEHRKQVRGLERRAQRAERDFDRLRARRLVRVALALAAWVRPVFRAVRRVRKARQAASPTPAASGQAVVAEPRGRVPDASADTPPIVALDIERAHEWLESRRPASRGQPQPVTIVIPVYGGGVVVERCLDAVVRHTSGPARLCLVDDATPDEETRALLRRFAERPNVDLLVNEENQGFTASVNRGFRHAEGDVVVLNSDTQVGPRWLQRLQQAAYSRSTIGTVTAVSDDAGAFSVPEPGRRNELPRHLDPETAARLIAQTSIAELPSAPTGNGFCWYVKRALLDDVGLFDEEAFPRGYGEENDLSMRALRAGWEHVVEPGTLVRHLRGTSFADERTGLMTRGRVILDERYPEYTPLVREFMRSIPMSNLRNRTRQIWAAPDLSPAGLPTVLYVLQAGRGGSPAAALDLAQAMDGRYNTLLLTCDATRYRLHRLVDREPLLIEEHELATPITFGVPRRRDTWELLASLMARHAVEVVHIRHLVKQTLDAPDVATALGIPYILSLHDYYLACPTINLLDESGRFCGGRCTDGPGRCPIPMSWIDSDVEKDLKHDGVYRWRQTVRPVLTGADALVTTSVSARSVFENAFPDLNMDRMRIIEHGRDLEVAETGTTPPEPDEPVRILVPGNLDVHKGAHLIADMRAAPGGDRLEFHFLGNVPDRFAALGVDHGRYSRDEFAERVREIGPHLIGVLSTCGETYSHTLSEAWMTDVPVVATDIGAMGERVRQHGGALLVPHDDPATACRLVLEFAEDPSAYDQLRGPAPGAVRSTGAMAMDYDALYQEVLRDRLTFHPPAEARSTPPATPSSSLTRQPLRLGLIALGSDRRAPGSVQVRTLRRLSHPTTRRSVVARRVEVNEVVSGSADVDVLLVQRTAVPPSAVTDFVRSVDAHGYRLVVEVDDLLWDETHLPGDGDGDWQPHVLSLQTLIRRADVVTVSTPFLAERAVPLNPNVAVVGNDLDERLWLRPLDASTQAAGGNRDVFDVLYVGSRTHASDLALMDPVFERLQESSPGSWRLTVVGGETSRSVDPKWYRRIDPPPAMRDYAAFVPWIRSFARSFDVAVAPLADTTFARAKSDLKWLEYTAMGLPCVLSDVGPYAASVRDGVTGLLVANTPHAWIDALQVMRDQPRVAGRLHLAAAEEVEGARLLRHSLPDWVDLLHEAATTRRRPSTVTA